MYFAKNAPVTVFFVRGYNKTGGYQDDLERSKRMYEP